MTQHGYTWTEQENMTPFERGVFTQMVISRLEKRAREGENNE